MPGFAPRAAIRAALFGLLLLAAPAAAGPEGVRLAPATPGAVRFTVTIPAATLSDFGKGEPLRLLDVEGFARIGEPGEPGLPTRVVNVAVPPLGDVQVSGVASAATTFADVLLAPEGPRGEPGAAAVPALRSGAAAGSSVPVAARLLGVDWVRNQRIARIAIEPAAYEPAARRLSVAGRIDVEVRVEPMGALGGPAEPNDAFEPTYRAILVNYEQGRAWRRPTTAALAAEARRRGIAPASVSAVQLEPTSVFAQHSWVKIAITEPGLYAVNFSSLRLLDLFGNEGAAFDSLRLFTLPGFPQLPEENYCDSCDLKEVAIGVVDVAGGADCLGPADSLFSCNSDYFYFFAQGVNGWATDFDATLPDTLHLNHPYETKNYYYLTIATAAEPVPGPPARIGTPVDRPTLPGATPVTTVEARRHFEQDIEYWPNATSRGSTLFWEKWFWRSLGANNTLLLDFDLPGADSLQPARLRLRQWAISPRNCSSATPDHNLDVSLNGFVFSRLSWKRYAMYPLPGGQGTLDSTDVFVRSVGNRLEMTVPRLTANCPSDPDLSALAWYDLFYQRRLEPVADRLEFRSPPGPGTWRYDIGPFTALAPPRLFDITDPLAPVEIAVNAAMYDTLPGGVLRHLVFDDDQADRRRYLVVPDSLVSIARVPTSSLADAAASTPRNLRAPENAADYVVIYYDEFAAAAGALATARRTRLPIVGRSSFETMAIPVSAIYDHFSGGRTDPAAIRNFLRAAFYNWTVKPTFVTFLGDASYDFKDITGRAPEGRPGCLLPTWEGGFDASAILLRQYASDDWLLNVDDASSIVPDFYGGRLPVNDSRAALSLVNDKVLAYEASAPSGTYRNRVLLMADDDIQVGNPDFGPCDPLSWIHLSQTELLAGTIPTHVDRQYVYLHTYPSPTLGVRADARVDLKAKLNDGVSILNFVGHGSPFKLSDESVFIDSDAGTLTNGLRMFLVVAASCDVGKFNDPTVQSLGERLVTTASNGAISVISATEEAFSGQNSVLNRFLFNRLFQRDTLAIGQAGGDTLPGIGQYHTAISAALLAAKLDNAGSTTNNSKYQVMGDAATRLSLPRLWADVALFDENGDTLVQIPRGGTVTFRGRVLDSPGGQPLPYDGIASVLIEDSAPRDRTPPGCFTGSTTLYTFEAGPIYQGDVSVSDGFFEGRFVTAMDATLGTRGRARAYLQGRSGADAFDSDGAGSSAFEVLAGTPPPEDDEGPRITLSFVGGATTVRPDATLQIDLFDESGIMTTGHALQNSIVVTLDDNTTSRVDVSASFRYAADSYQAGKATFQLPGLAPGRHRVKVSAADNLATGFAAAQHRSTATLEFDVVEETSLGIRRAFLFPNPVSSGGPGSGGTFVIEAPGDSVNTLLRLYTVSGRLIRQFRVFGGLGQVQIPWDGRDAEGDPLANGTYLFKVFVYGREADGESRADQRAASEGRFVVLNR